MRLGPPVEGVGQLAPDAEVRRLLSIERLQRRHRLAVRRERRGAGSGAPLEGEQVAEPVARHRFLEPQIGSKAAVLGYRLVEGDRPLGDPPLELHRLGLLGPGPTGHLGGFAHLLQSHGGDGEAALRLLLADPGVDRGDHGRRPEQENGHHGRLSEPSRAAVTAQRLGDERPSVLGEIVGTALEPASGLGQRRAAQQRVRIALRPLPGVVGGPGPLPPEEELAVLRQPVPKPVPAAQQGLVGDLDLVVQLTVAPGGAEAHGQQALVDQTLQDRRRRAVRLFGRQQLAARDLPAGDGTPLAGQRQVEHQPPGGLLLLRAQGEEDLLGVVFQGALDPADGLVGLVGQGLGRAHSPKLEERVLE